MITAHTFVSEVVASRFGDPPTALEERCTIAAVDQVEGISANEARRAVLAVHAMMAWEHAQLYPTPAATSSGSEPPPTPTKPSASSD